MALPGLSLPPLTLAGGAGGAAGPSGAGLDTGGLAGLFGMDDSGWTVSTGNSKATGGTSGGGGAGASAAGGGTSALASVPWTLLIAAGLLAIVLWRRA